jgi:hypothetical protein
MDGGAANFAQIKPIDKVGLIGLFTDPDEFSTPPGRATFMALFFTFR